MPTTYTHYRFGDKCLKLLPSKYQDIINKYRDVYNYGVHGPDFLFYYKFWSHNDVNDYGSWMHDTSCDKHLEKFKENLKKSENKEAALAYLFGFVSHFTLDSYCHSYIEKITDDTDVNHARVESQFDRYLLLKDGLNPRKTNGSNTLIPSKECCHTISQLYDKYDEETISTSVKHFKFALTLLKNTNNLKKSILVGVMNKLNAQDYIDLMIDEKDDPRCLAINMRLEKYFNKALEHFEILSKSFIDYIEEDKPLDEYFKNCFDQKPDYKNIPILNIEDERKYNVEFQK